MYLVIVCFGVIVRGENDIEGVMYIFKARFLCRVGEFLMVFRRVSCFFVLNNCDCYDEKIKIFKYYRNSSWGKM